MTTALAVDVGGTKLAAALIHHDGTVLTRAEVATPRTAEAGALTDELLALASRVIAADPGRMISALGVGSAGPVDLIRGTISPVNILGWRSFPILDALRELLPGRPAVLAGDGHCMALGEHRFGGFDSRALLGMVVSTGVGGGIVLDGKLHPGPTGNAAHIGHIVVDLDGGPCPCGGRGCVEAIASGPCMVRWAQEQGWSGQPDGRSLAASAMSGDRIAREAFTRAGRAIAAAVVSAAAMIDLDDAVIGGGVAQSGPLIFRPIRRALNDLAGLPFVRRVQVHEARLGRDAGLLGAAALAFDEAAAAVAAR
ncbi:glucokinase [Allocatelliglobosispora scoriae]|uniref:Glucokinase n=1 Tax=Allocatelliglobosispora scoriae TaxID=643052 RepID=A0A841BRB2_9ACTN|nr:ROK family protein [Allocatelliglobosispora scoriae]MBB5869453.1 glucokinase [Allocatelliglobosispora scoriae]